MSREQQRFGARRVPAAAQFAATVVDAYRGVSARDSARVASRRAVPRRDPSLDAPRTSLQPRRRRTARARARALDTRRTCRARRPGVGPSRLRAHGPRGRRAGRSRPRSRPGLAPRAAFSPRRHRGRASCKRARSGRRRSGHHARGPAGGAGSARPTRSGGVRLGCRAVKLLAGEHQASVSPGR